MKNKLKLIVVATLGLFMLTTEVKSFLSNTSCYAQEQDTTKIKKALPAKIGHVKEKNKKRESTLHKKSSEEMFKKRLEKEIASYRPDVPLALEFLKNPNPDRRTLAEEILGKARDPRAIQPLMKVLATDTVAIVRGYAARALGKICGYLNDKSCIPALKLALQDNDKGVALNAALALVKLGEYDASFPLLISIFIGENIEQWQVEGFAGVGSGVKGEKRIAVMKRMKKTMREWALQGLAQIGNERVKLALKNSLDNITDRNLKERTKNVIKSIERRMKKAKEGIK